MLVLEWRYLTTNDADVQLALLQHPELKHAIDSKEPYFRTLKTSGADKALRACLSDRDYQTDMFGSKRLPDTGGHIVLEGLYYIMVRYVPYWAECLPAPTLSGEARAQLQKEQKAQRVLDGKVCLIYSLYIHTLGRAVSHVQVAGCHVGGG